MTVFTREDADGNSTGHMKGLALVQQSASLSARYLHEGVKTVLSLWPGIFIKAVFSQDHMFLNKSYIQLSLIKPSTLHLT